MDFRSPLQDPYPVTQNFGENPEWYARFGQKGHTGLDYGVPAGTPVLAAAAGTVIKTGFEKDGYGNYVKVAHGSEYVTIYAHLSKIQVCKAQKIDAGQQIALSGSTGFSTGPHLHFEIRQNNTPVDPLASPGAVTSTTPQSEEAPTGSQAPAKSIGVCVARVTTDLLNIRTRPSLSSPVIGRLAKDQKVPILERSATIWVRIGQDAWVALMFNNEPYLEEVQP